MKPITPNFVALYYVFHNLIQLRSPLLLNELIKKRKWVSYNGIARAGTQTRHARHIHNRRTALQVRHRRACDIVRPSQVRIDQLIKILIRRVRDGQGGRVDAGAVEDPVDMAMGLERVGHGTVTLRAGAYIAWERRVSGSGGRRRRRKKVAVGEVFEEAAEAFLIDIAKGEGGAERG